MVSRFLLNFLGFLFILKIFERGSFGVWAVFFFFGYFFGFFAGTLGFFLFFGIFGFVLKVFWFTFIEVTLFFLLKSTFRSPRTFLKISFYLGFYILCISCNKEFLDPWYLFRVRFRVGAIEFMYESWLLISYVWIINSAGTTSSFMELSSIRFDSFFSWTWLLKRFISSWMFRFNSSSSMLALLWIFKLILSFSVSWDNMPYSDFYWWGFGDWL